MSHLLYVSGQKHDYMGYCKFGPKKFLAQEEPVRLEKVCLVTVLFHPQQGHALNQHALISSNWFTDDLWLNPKCMGDAREVPNDSPIKKTYLTSLEKARIQNAGITLVKSMPQNLPGISNN